LLWDAFQIFAGWWGHQPRLTAMVGVPTDHNQSKVRKFEMHPLWVSGSVSTPL
jgi:hypothetical protein